MNRLAFAALVLAPLTAAAQPSATDPVAAPDAPSPNATNGAPQNEPWSNVSHINGQLVPVGERNDYLYTQKKTNISSNPIGWITGFYGVSVSEAVSQNLAIRFDANYMTVGSETGYEVGVSLPIYLKRTYYGPFIEPGVVVRSMTNTESYDSCSDCSYSMTSSNTHTLVGPEVMVGYQWMFDSGLNVAAALGAARNLNASQDSSSADSNIEPVGYFRVGYAF